SPAGPPVPSPPVAAPPSGADPCELPASRTPPGALALAPSSGGVDAVGRGAVVTPGAGSASLRAPSVDPDGPHAVHIATPAASAAPDHRPRLPNPRARIAHLASRRGS